MGAPASTTEPELAARLLGLAERRGRELAAARGYETPLLDIFCIGVNRAKRDLLLRRGYALSRTVYRMGADLGGEVVAVAGPGGHRDPARSAPASTSASCTTP